MKTAFTILAIFLTATTANAATFRTHGETYHVDCHKGCDWFHPENLTLAQIHHLAAAGVITRIR